MSNEAIRGMFLALSNTVETIDKELKIKNKLSFIS
jgi:hypothetical protein